MLTAFFGSPTSSATPRLPTEGAPAFAKAGLGNMPGRIKWRQRRAKTGKPGDTLGLYRPAPEFPRRVSPTITGERGREARRSGRAARESARAGEQRFTWLLEPAE